MVFLQISQNSLEDTFARVSFLIKLQTFRPAILLKRRLWQSCFPVNFVKFLRTPFYRTPLVVPSVNGLLSACCGV